MTKLYLFCIEHTKGKTTYEWFAPGVKYEDDTDADAAHNYARHTYPQADFISAVRDNTGKLVTKEV